MAIDETETDRRAPRRGTALLVLALLVTGCQSGTTGQQGPQNSGEPEKRAVSSAGKPEEQSSTNPADPKRQSIENLRRIAQAMKKYAKDHYDLLPPAAYMDENLRIKQFQGLTWPASELARQGGNYKLKGRTVPLFSWRVALLPYLGEVELAKQFKMDETWDSPHNQKLQARMPAVYAAPSTKADTGVTYYQVFVGQDTPFNGMEPPRVPSKFMDGTFSTFLIVEAGEAVPWNKPEDMPYDPGKPLPKLGGLFADGFHAAMADGHIRFVPRDAPEKQIRAAITSAGVEPPDPPGEAVK
jgi:hypothetical protein